MSWSRARPAGWCALRRRSRRLAAAVARRRPAAPYRPPAAPPASRRDRTPAAEPSAGDAEPGLGHRPRRASPSTTASATRASATRSAAPSRRTTCASTSSTPPAKSSRASTATTSRPTPSTASAGTGRRAKAARRRNGRYSFRIGPRPAAAPAARARRPPPNRSASASPSTATPSRSSAPTTSAAPTAASAPPRSGHTHQGQDVMAACGTPLVAARGGTRPVRRLPGARRQLPRHRRQGHRAATSCTRTCAEPSPLQTGEPVRTGQPIGDRRRDRRRHRLPPPLRDLDRARLVRGRQPDRPAALPRKMGPLQLSRFRLRR